MLLQLQAGNGFAALGSRVGAGAHPLLGAFPPDPTSGAVSGQVPLGQNSPV